MKRISFQARQPAGQFRSGLERDIADALSEQGVEYEYERSVVLPDGKTPYYLPDFTIDRAPPHLSLPRWIEAKPQQFLYDLRDALGVTRRYGERFKGDVAVDGVDAGWLRGRGSELWKPKMLAEVTGDCVLVVGGAGGLERLSVEMRPAEIVLSRQHPFVNSTGVKRKRERDERANRWRAEQEAARLRWQQLEDARLAAIERQRAATLRAALPSRLRGPNRYDAHCGGCDVRVCAGMGSLYVIPLGSADATYVVLCDHCRCNVDRRATGAAT